MKDKIMIVLV